MRMRTTLAAATVLAAGALLGWLTASGRLVGPAFAQDKAKADKAETATRDKSHSGVVLVCLARGAATADE